MDSRMTEHTLHEGAMPDATMPDRAMAGAEAARTRRPLRVCAFPKDRFKDTQPFHALLSDSVEERGEAVLEEFSAKRCLTDRYDVVHVHHPEKFVSQRLGPRDALRFAGFFTALWTQKAKGARIVWTAHNEGPHEPGHPLLERLYWRLFLPALDGVVYLSESSRGHLARERPRLSRLPSFVIPHGDFRGAYPNEIDREAARRRLGYGPEHRVLTFVGNVRAYKNAGHLARTFAELPGDNLRLLIAGHVHTPALKAEIMEVAARDPRIRLIDAFVDTADMQLYLNAADLVVLPFRKILNSGSAILALSFDRPVLVPDLGSLRELQEQVGEDWVRLFRGELDPATLADALDGFLDRPRPARAPLDALSWDEIGRATAAAYRALV